MVFLYFKIRLILSAILYARIALVVGGMRYSICGQANPEDNVEGAIRG